VAGGLQKVSPVAFDGKALEQHANSGIKQGDTLSPLSPEAEQK
jgi:hypothetical protein